MQECMSTHNTTGVIKSTNNTTMVSQRRWVSVQSSCTDKSQCFKHWENKGNHQWLREEKGESPITGKRRSEGVSTTSEKFPGRHNNGYTSWKLSVRSNSHNVLLPLIHWQSPDQPHPDVVQQQLYSWQKGPAESDQNRTTPAWLEQYLHLLVPPESNKHLEGLIPPSLWVSSFWH